MHKIWDTHYSCRSCSDIGNPCHEAPSTVFVLMPEEVCSLSVIKSAHFCPPQDSATGHHNMVAAGIGCRLSKLPKGKRQSTPWKGHQSVRKL